MNRESVGIVLVISFCIVLMFMATEDRKQKRIKDKYPWMIFLMSCLAAVVMDEISVGNRLMGMLAVSVPMLCIGGAVPGSFGGGDIKLSFACGAFLGSIRVVNGAVTAICLAGVYSLVLLIKQQKKSGRERIEFAFGPFLCTGYVLEALVLLLNICL